MTRLKRKPKQGQKFSMWGRVDEARRQLGDGATPQTVYDHLTARETP